MSCCDNQCVKYDHFIKTPLIESTQFKEFCNQKIYLKLENCQPCGSFKMRGISRLSQQAVRDGCEEVICASGGNAGLAAACAARRCGIKCRIIVPKTTSKIMKDMIAGEGAHIEVFGDVLNDAEEKAIKEVKKSNKSYFIHPFNNPIIWTGHSTIIDEIVKQLDTIPSLIISSCGGGGLICGLAEGLRRNKWTSVPILAMETKGCNSLNAAVKAGTPIKPVKIPSINSVATSLGALEICQQLADDYNKGLPPIISHVIDDKETVDACIKFANQHRILVEPACGVSLAAIYTGFVRQLFTKNKGKYSDGPVVVIVCGGCGVTTVVFIWEYHLEYKKTALSKGYKELVTASGGNAGLAVAYSSRKLGVKCNVVVPSVASPKVIDILEKYGATVEVYGHTSIDVTNRALELTKTDPNKFFVHPFDHHILWSGHSTIIDEIAQQLKEEPAVVITCCGGGGLLCGIIEGMRRHQWTNAPVIAMETTGTASFNACVKSGGNVVTLEKSTGVAVSLSPIRVCDQLVEYYRQSKPPIVSYLVEDSDAIDSCIKFANDHRLLVEASCGTALSAIYKGLVNEVIDVYAIKRKAIVVIVCGGAAIDLNLLNSWSTE